MRWAGSVAVGGSGAVFEPFNETMAVAYMETGKMGYHDDGESTLGPTVASLSLGCTSVMQFRPKKKTNLGKKSGNQKGEKPDMVKIVLEHGDMMVMHGVDIQRLYEHQVVSYGKMRFALTCRHIVPEKIPDATVRAKSIIDGTLPEDIGQYLYDGDEHAEPIPYTTGELMVNRRTTKLAELDARLSTGTLAEQEARLNRLDEFRFD